MIVVMFFGAWFLDKFFPEKPRGSYYQAHTADRQGKTS